MARTARQLLALRVRTLRRTRGWSQEDLAEASGLHRTYVGGIERAERNCTLDVLVSLAAALDISLAELLIPPELETRDEVRESPPGYGPLGRDIGRQLAGRPPCRHEVSRPSHRAASRLARKLTPRPSRRSRTIRPRTQTCAAERLVR